MVNEKLLSSLSPSKSYHFQVFVRDDNRQPFWRFSVTLNGNEVSVYLLHLLDVYPSSFKIRVFLFPSYETVFYL